jgi:hypothetical protein
MTEAIKTGSTIGELIAEFPITQSTPKEHALIRHLPRWTGTEEFNALIESVRDQGILDPIKVTATGELIDGRHRLEASRRLKLTHIPAIIVADDVAGQIAVASLLHRRHLTDGQKAWYLVTSGLIDSAFDERQKRKIANLKVGSFPERNSVPFGTKRVEDWAAELGVSVKLLIQAREVKTCFADTTRRTITDRDGVTEDEVTFQDFFEPRILRSEDHYGLGAVITACTTLAKLRSDHTGGKPKDEGRKSQLLVSSFETIAKRADYWSEMTEESKRVAIGLIRPQFEAVPDDLLEALYKVIISERTSRKQAEKAD